MGEPDRAHVRLAELVAALSLGVDLGFGQPMEHVLRQCLIALRLAERIGLDEDERAVTYYTALLVNVGCHSDAHEQAKWFGDDIALKSGKYASSNVRAAAAAFRLVGSGNPPLHRFRVGLEFAISGHRDVDKMMSYHAAIARSLADELGLPGAVAEAMVGAYEQCDGRGGSGGRGRRPARAVGGGGAHPAPRRSRARPGATGRVELDLGQPGPLGSGEWERMRMHSYLTHRMLRQSEALAPLGAIAVQHTERLDGSGYPSGLSGAAISRPARILGAADVYQAMREPRPHRPPRSADDAAAELRG